MTRDQSEIARLEDVANCWRQGCIEARAEVERLQAQITRERKVFHETQWRQLKEAHGEIERLQASLKMTNGGERELSAFLKQEAEVERLRTALQRIADDGKNCQDYCRNQAARALEPKP